MGTVSIKRLMQLAPVAIAVALLGLFLIVQGELFDTQARVAEDVNTADAVIAMKDTRYYVVQIQQFLTDVGATRNDEAVAEARESKKGAEASLDRLKALLPEFANQAQELKGKIETLFSAGVIMGNAYIKQGTEAGNLLMKGRGGFDESAGILAEQLEVMSSGLEAKMQRSARQALESTAHARVVLIIGSVVVGLFALAVMMLLYRRIIPSLNSLEKSMEDIASGAHDLTIQLNDSGCDELARVAGSFNHFIGYICKFMRRVDKDSVELAAAAEQMSSASNRTLSGMQHLQREAGDVSRAMEQMQQAVMGVQHSAHEAANAADAASTEAKNGEAVVRQTIDSIHGLADGVQKAGDVLHKLEADSDNIGSILDVIRGIADQTNLLALNAAIEAARAGDQGRGFAVVADEVRSLAQRTQESTQEIQQMISLLQTGAKDAVGVMDHSRELADATVSQAATTRESLARITEAVDTIRHRASEIDRAAQQQGSVSELINRNITNISEEADRTVDDAQVSRNASTEIDAQLSVLRQEVGLFTIR